MKALYADAKRFLLKNIPSPQRKEILESYLELPDGSAEPVEIPVLFERLLSSAQNANMKAGVIGESIGGVHNLGKVLFNFDPHKILKEYAGVPEKLLGKV